MMLHYFYDFISPFGYLLHERLRELPDQVELTYTPVLFAGLLKYWGQLGPAEIGQKKIFTYRHTTWLAERLGVPFRMPDTHPFNPLPYLRLCIAMDNQPELVSAIFRAIWATPNNPATDVGRQAIWELIGIPDADDRIVKPQIKQHLIQNTQQAADKGVFGVPTILADDELFWGLDSFDFLLDYLANRQLFERQSMSRLDCIEYGAKR